MRIVIAGKPGSGKGTQAALLSERLGLPHLSSGEILRNEIQGGTAFGKEVEEYVRRGEIGPERLITSVILDYIKRNNLVNSFILDGFPRTLYQAETLDSRFAPETCILLSLPDTVIFSRLLNRLTCSGCGRVYHLEQLPPLLEDRCDACGSGLVKRIDDRHETVERRLEVFRKEVTPVISLYRDTQRLAPIDGSLAPDEIGLNILEAVNRARSVRPARRPLQSAPSD